MKFVKKITTTIDSLNTKNFYIYSGIFLGIIFIINIFIIFNFYTSMHTISAQIEEINEFRTEQVQPLLNKAYQVHRQREQFDALLAQDPDFKLGSYIKDQLTELHLTNNKETETITTIDREEKYSETVMNLKLIDMNMEQLAQFLEKIENEPRINAKTIDIIKSKKKPNTIEVLLTIAALQQK